jgi:hypothetical protein
MVAPDTTFPFRGIVLDHVYAQVVWSCIGVVSTMMTPLSFGGMVQWGLGDRHEMMIDVRIARTLSSVDGKDDEDYEDLYHEDDWQFECTNDFCGVCMRCSLNVC